MMSLRTTCWLAAALAAAVSMAAPPPASASWTGDHCYIHNVEDENVRRVDARSYAVVGVGEGYEWGGGCWNNNGVDDTPGAPDSGGEGPDCSGFVFKTWELRVRTYLHDFIWWSRMQNIHGPYVANTFHAPGDDLPFFVVSKSRSSMVYMDAFASSTHVGMLYTAVNPSSGTDWVIEARGDPYGVDVWERDMRYDSSYTAARRRNWTPDCYPNCATPVSPVVVR